MEQCGLTFHSFLDSCRFSTLAGLCYYACMHPAKDRCLGVICPFPFRMRGFLERSWIFRLLKCTAVELVGGSLAVGLSLAIDWNVFRNVSLFRNS